jgi:hypothetical protein
MPSVQLLRIDASIDEGGIMSLQAARDFLDAANDSEEIRNQVRERRSVLEIGRDHGYDFTHDEISQAMGERNLEPLVDADDIACVIM